MLRQRCSSAALALPESDRAQVARCRGTRQVTVFEQQFSKSPRDTWQQNWCLVARAVLGRRRIRSRSVAYGLLDPGTSTVKRTT